MLTVFTGLPVRDIKHRTPALSSSESSMLSPTMRASATLREDHFVRFGTEEDRQIDRLIESGVAILEHDQLTKERDAQSARKKADDAYAHYKTLPHTAKDFNAKVKELIARASTQKVKESTQNPILTEEEKTKIQAEYLKHIIKQWYIVLDRYAMAAMAVDRSKGNYKSIIPTDLAPPTELPGITPYRANTLRTQDDYLNLKRLIPISVTKGG
jgi:hypothetical protein